MAHADMALTLEQSLLVGLLYFAANTSFLGGLGYFTTWRPMVNGLLVGLILGDPVRGTTIGALINVLYLGYISVGGTLGIGDAALAGIMGATIGISLHVVDPTQAIGIGVLGGIVAGSLGFPLLSLRMKLDNRIVHLMDRAAAHFAIHTIEWLNIALAQALLLLITTLPVLCLSLAVPPFVNLAVNNLPAWTLRSLGIAGTGVTGALGIALAMKSVFKGRGVIVFLLGFAIIAIAEINVAMFVIAALALLLASDLVKLAWPRVGFGRNRATGVFLLWQFFSHSSYSYERLQGSGVASALAPALRRMYTTPTDKVAALQRHLTFFNVEPNWGSVVIGAILKMEEQHAAKQVDVDAIISTRQSLMGAVSGFGDRVSQGAILPLLLSIGIAIVLSANNTGGMITGVVTYLVLICPVMVAISAWCFFAGCSDGRDAVINILGSNRLKWWIGIAELCGAFMLGVLAAMKGVTGLHLSNLELLPPVIDAMLRFGLVAVFYIFVQRLHVRPTLILTAVVLVSLLAGFIGVI